MAKKLLLLISGSSGVGKNTVITNVLNKNKSYKLLCSHTTREPRIDDNLKYVPYIFVDKQTFENMIENGDVLEYDIFNEQYYGISKDEIKKTMDKYSVILKDITIKGMLSCKELLSEKLSIISVFLTERKSILKKRLRERKTADIKGRLKIYKFEQKKIPLYDYVIVNNNLTNTMDKIYAIINSNNEQLELLSAVSLQSINQNKIDKYINKLEKNKKIKPIKVCAYNGYIYIVEGVNRYLASLKQKRNLLKEFVECEKNNIENINIDEWKKIVELYK